MEWQSKSPLFGDIIRTKVSFYHHYGIFIDENNIIQFGLPNDVSRPANEIKVLSSDITSFLNGGEIEVAVLNAKEKIKARSRKKRIEYAKRKIGSDGYHIFYNNCEHFVYECLFGEKNSEFINSVRTELRQKLGK